MKRAIVAAVCLALLLPVLAVVGYASTSYTFYRYEPATLYGETSDFFPDDEDPIYFRYDGILPAGKYKVTVLGEIDGHAYETTSEGDGINITSDGFAGPVSCSCYVDGVFTESIVYDVNIFFEDELTFFSVSVDGGHIVVGLFTVAHFELVDDAVSLTDYVTAESMDAILDEVVALIPVVLTVIVGYIGIRKVISWLQGVLHNS